MVRALVNRPALGNFPSIEWLSTLQNGVLKAAPKGFDQVFAGMSGSDANEAAFKAACIWKAQIDQGGATVPFTEEEIRSAMIKKHMEARITLYYHSKADSTTDCTTRSKAIHKLDIPAFDWHVHHFQG